MNKLNRKALKALDERLIFFWTGAGLRTVQLRAISVTYENGREVSRKIEEFDLEQVYDMFDVQHLLLDQINHLYSSPAIKHTPNLMEVLQNYWWKDPKKFKAVPEKMLEEWKVIQDAKHQIATSTTEIVLNGRRENKGRSKHFEGLDQLFQTAADQLCPTCKGQGTLPAPSGQFTDRIICTDCGGTGKPKMRTVK